MIVLFDLDGTLADIQHRRHHVEKPDKTDADWRAFYAACVADTIYPDVVHVFRAHQLAGDEVWIVSGRSDEVRVATEMWLMTYGLRPDRLIMRPAKDHQPDHKLKRTWLNDGTIPKSEVLCVYDDRTSVVNMWREEGLTCFQVAPGDF